jgi:cytidylate kinase
MNIVEAYIKFKGQLLIFISGLPGCGKMELAKNISQDFKLKLIDQYDYYIKDYNVKAMLQDGVELINWYTDSAIDWERFNADINNFKTSGLVVIGVSFPIDKLSSHADFHIHLNISKQICMQRRKEFLEKHKDDKQYKEEFDLIDTQTEKLKMNQLIFPYYLDSIKKAKVNKFININEISNDQVYDIAYDYIIDIIKKYLKHDEPISSENSLTPKVSKVTKTKNKKKFEKEEPIIFHAELLSEPKYTYEFEDSLNMMDKVFTQSDFSEDEGPIYFIEPNL